MDAISSQYPILFGKDGKKNQEPGGEEGDDDEDQGTSSFRDRWGWVANVDLVSETIRESWDHVFRMPAIEFLNIICYCKDKAEDQKAQIAKWKKEN